ncbi:hypothetical protein SEA_WOFFORD_238 [Streptomyces phage Wofford]|uniref:Uncharacterized protein n=1 Tax=Streptomyces phage Wofford TaxID=2283267 RepID=A0A345MA53_9CAUD|nr:hypothetical protein HWB78_gp080 [Streptomyces phage Wollford]AXH67374.1 hypothetical protein SEA_WOFFORD_238 [Streptomyces phage Wollford]
MSELVCQICDKQRNSLVNYKSRLNPDMEFMACSPCASGEIEPRWLVILMARSGTDVSRWVENRLYYGDDITSDHLN